MKRSIYSKIVLSFIATILLSTFLSFFVTRLFYQNEIKSSMEKETESVGNEFINLYKKEGGEIATSILSHSSFINYSFYVFDAGLKIKTFNKTSSELSINRKDIESVLSSKKGAVFLQSNKGRHEGLQKIAGIPFQNNGEKYALIVLPNIEGEIVKGVERLQIIQLFCVLLIGSFIFVSFSRKLVKPIRKLTYATKEIGRGNYRIELPKSSNDEIGILTEHFNQMTEKLNKIEEMRQEFVSSVSHEIQSPLTSIRGFAKALKEQPLSESERISYLEIIEQESHRLAQLGGNLLKLASLDSEHHPIHLKRYSIDEQIRKVILSLQPQWELKNISFELALPKIQIEADEDLLEQVWMNLVTNSIKYTPENGKITISLKEKDLKLICQISDKGIGIPKEQQPFIFERFYKADRARSSKGSGLGLAITKKIVELHHGTITVDSQEGKGSCFTITLISNLR